jgi:hypothetical protein
LVPQDFLFCVFLETGLHLSNLSSISIVNGEVITVADSDFLALFRRSEERGFGLYQLHVLTFHVWLAQNSYRFP